MIRLKNDHKDLMSRIEKGTCLSDWYWLRSTCFTSGKPWRRSRAAKTTTLRPSYNGGSSAYSFRPCQYCSSIFTSFWSGMAFYDYDWLQGLQQHDKIVKFGTCYAHNNSKLARLAEVVQSSEGREIDVIVLREEERVSIRLTPRNGWGGRGMLGCHLLPI